MKILAYGSPAPQGSKKGLGVSASGKTRFTEASTKTKPWRADVLTAAQAVIEATPDFAPFDGAVIARMVFSFWRPKSVTFRKRPYVTVAPDLCKLARSTEDALKAAGVYRDDCLIVEYTRLAKVYIGEDPEALERPGCLILLGELVPPEPIAATRVRPVEERAEVLRGYPKPNDLLPGWQQAEWRQEAA